MISDNVFVVCCDSAMRLAYKQLSFSRYAYDGEDQCLSPVVRDVGPRQVVCDDVADAAHVL